ncbi:putative FBD-associated F-box protein At5g56560 [Castanea sativa]|uniref:putative FBD-associated F-box protein At5g56560 n=1 Tax=Castanea sativa TaxID=21020 RepID=UPI003F654219
MKEQTRETIEKEGERERQMRRDRIGGRGKEKEVSNIFTLHTSKAIPLLKLRINWCRKCEPFYVHKWVQHAILHGRLQELDVHIFSCGQLMELPPSLFFCSTLVVLKLDGNKLLLNPPASAFRFPSLRILLLKWVSYANNDSLPTLLAACPVLQDLTLTMHRDVFKRTNKNAGKFNILVLVPTLKKFTINTRLSSYAQYKLLINTPALEYFHFKGVLDENIVLESLPNLVKSFLQVEKHRVLTTKDYAKRIWDFMGQLYNAISMELSIETAEILYHASNDDVPIFHNLSSLKLYSLYSPKRYTWHVGNYFTPIGYLDEALRLPEYKSPYFTTCHYEGFRGLNEEMKLDKQILKAASVLKTLTIVVGSQLGTKEKHRDLKRLREFPKSSQICKIAFD